MTNVAHVMTSEVFTVSPLSSVTYAASEMDKRNIGVLPVVHEDKLVGILTDRDVVIRGVAKISAGMFSQVSDIMTPSVIYCLPDDDIEDAVRLMANHQIRRVPVREADGTLCGMLSLSDIAHYAEDAASFALTEICEPIQVSEEPVRSQPPTVDAPEYAPM